MDVIEILRDFASRLQCNGSVTPTNEDIASTLREAIEAAEAADDEFAAQAEIEGYTR